ncbi:hypothetical protein TBLA_0B02370 [Henningerozyma blattae CBS 6284]|uniref:Uncharacterized protein n=1 Tax=Henningerozyma blattae (strain ATCC 34711 / CBS 6284 / DSM 70876 / NBRC 10599 / NRRL Y-10934 / UCD 77-7) TaxID=1071380 RepID=I2GY77_HENB6|nr:hypothetical protein TBLA_0B02370 [Tetrapisispora blattae CBS 6284]CCH59079.1 hypothetical protein TBLA_0B02370 [Tetrapisispora blattae CBS 6284]
MMSEIFKDRFNNEQINVDSQQSSSDDPTSAMSSIIHQNSSPLKHLENNSDISDDESLKINYNISRPGTGGSIKHYIDKFTNSFKTKLASSSKHKEPTAKSHSPPGKTQERQHLKHFTQSTKFNELVQSTSQNRAENLKALQGELIDKINYMETPSEMHEADSCQNDSDKIPLGRYYNSGISQVSDSSNSSLTDVSMNEQCMENDLTKKYGHTFDNPIEYTNTSSNFDSVIINKNSNVWKVILEILSILTGKKKSDISSLLMEKEESLLRIITEIQEKLNHKVIDMENERSKLHEYNDDIILEYNKNNEKKKTELDDTIEYYNRIKNNNLQLTQTLDKRKRYLEDLQMEIKKYAKEELKLKSLEEKSFKLTDENKTLREDLKKLKNIHKDIQNSYTDIVTKYQLLEEKNFNIKNKYASLQEKERQNECNVEKCRSSVNSIRINISHIDKSIEITKRSNMKLVKDKKIERKKFLDIKRELLDMNDIICLFERFRTLTIQSLTQIMITLQLFISEDNKDKCEMYLKRLSRNNFGVKFINHAEARPSNSQSANIGICIKDFFENIAEKNLLIPLNDHLRKNHTSSKSLTQKLTQLRIQVNQNNISYENLTDQIKWMTENYQKVAANKSNLISSNPTQFLPIK